MLPNLLRRITILARELIEITLRLNRMLDIPRITLRSRVMTFVVTSLGLDLGREDVARPRDDLMRGVRVARAPGHILRVVSGHGEVGRPDALVVEQVVLFALAAARDGRDGILQAGIVGHLGARGRHVLELAARVRVGGVVGGVGRGVV